MSERVCVSVCVYDAHDSHTFFLPKSYAEKSYPWVPLCTLECVITWVEVICPSVDAVFCFVSLFTHRTEKVFRKVLRTRQQRKFLHCGKRNTQRRSIAITVNPPGIVLSTGAFPLRWQMFTISVRVVFTEGKYLCDDDIKKDRNKLYAASLKTLLDLGVCSSCSCILSYCFRFPLVRTIKAHGRFDTRRVACRRRKTSRGTA